MARHRRHVDHARAARTASWPVGVASAATLAATPLAAAAPTASAAAPASHDDVPCASTADACVDLGAHRAWLMADGEPVEGPVPITSGIGRDRTPTGTFTVQWKDRDHTSGERGAPMPYSVFFDTEGRALHGGSLSRGSAGCVHLDEDDARTFYRALQPGDEVQIVA